MLKSFKFFNRTRSAPSAAAPLFDEPFLRRLERYNFRTAPALRGAAVGERRSRNLRPALDFSDHRPYSPGDDLRHVDWTVVARHEELFVKLGEATQSVSLHILLDQSASMAWESPAAKWLAARRLAGALAYLGLSGGERLTITPFANALAPAFGPTHGKRRAIAALQFLANLAPVPGPARPDQLTHSLTTYARHHPGGGLLILISDLLDTAPSAQSGPGLPWLANGLTHLSPPRWQVVVMHFLTQAELAPTLEGDFDLLDVESGQDLPFHLDAHNLAQYRLRARAWCREVQQVCARRGAAYTQVLAEWPFEKAVIPYLRRRGVVQ